MNKKALDLLRKYIDSQIVLEFKCEQAAAEDYYDESIPERRHGVEGTWKAFVDIMEISRPYFTALALELSDDMTIHKSGGRYRCIIEPEYGFCMELLGSKGQGEADTLALAVYRALLGGKENEDGAGQGT